jgi:hypothetical protein
MNHAPKAVVTSRDLDTSAVEELDRSHRSR